MNESKTSKAFPKFKVKFCLVLVLTSFESTSIPISSSTDEVLVTETIVLSSFLDHFI